MMIAARLKLARAASGLTLRELQERAEGVSSAQAISKYENGKAKPGTNVLIALASALDVPVDYLLAGDDIVLEGVESRETTAASCIAQARVHVALLRDLERYLTVEELLGLPAAIWDRPQGAPYPVDGGVLAADCAAESLRCAWKLGSGPIPNAVDLLEERGIKVVMVDVEDVQSMTINIRRRGGPATPAMVMRASLAGEQQRFGLVRELGHLVLDAPSMDSGRAASQFGRALLMPAEKIYAEVGRHRTSISLGELVGLKMLFRVSAQAIATRCKELGIIGRVAFAGLMTEFRRRGWCNPPFDEPGRLVAEQSTRFERLCFRALAEDVISESKAAELLDISVWQLDERMAAATAEA